MGVEATILAMADYTPLGDSEKEWPEHYKERMDNLFTSRKALLNRLFFMVGSAEECVRVRRLNERLTRMEKVLQSRAEEVEAVLRPLQDKYDYDNFLVEGIIDFWSNDISAFDVSPGIDLLNYGSSFKEVIPLAAKFTREEMGNTYITTFRNGKNLIEAKTCKWQNIWHESELFRNMPCCASLYELVYNRRFAIPDLIRMDNYDLRVTMSCSVGDACPPVCI